MKIKKIFSIIVVTVLCGGKINAQTTPANLTLSGTKTGNNEYEALNSIQSTQVIHSGTTTYTAGNEIVLNPGFETEAGAEFEAVIEDVSNRLTVMTYNINRREYTKHAKVIKASGADVVAIQEVQSWPITDPNFAELKRETGFNGHMCNTYNYSPVFVYGIVLLWNDAKLGNPIAITDRVINAPNATGNDDSKRGYIVAEFNDFCIVATHLPLNLVDNVSMSIEIIFDVNINYQKPVFIAGDLNPSGGEPINLLNLMSFEMLNYGDSTDEYYDKHATRTSGAQPDLIFWHNQNPNRDIIWNGVPECLWAPDTPNGYAGGIYKDWRFNISDHLPYVVKVKLK